METANFTDISNAIKELEAFKDFREDIFKKPRDTFSKIIANMKSYFELNAKKILDIPDYSKMLADKAYEQSFNEWKRFYNVLDDIQRNHPELRRKINNFDRAKREVEEKIVNLIRGAKKDYDLALCLQNSSMENISAMNDYLKAFDMGGI